MSKEVVIAKSNGNGFVGSLTFKLGLGLAALLVGMFIYGYNKIDDLEDRLRVVDVNIALSEQKIEDLSENVKKLLESNEELKEKINELTIGVNSCEAIKKKLRKTLNE